MHGTDASGLKRFRAEGTFSERYSILPGAVGAGSFGVVSAHHHVF